MAKFVLLRLMLSVVAASGCSPKERSFDQGGTGASGGTNAGGGGAGGKLEGCSPGSTRCVDNTVQTCDAGGSWQDEPPCPAEASVCREGVCSVPPSCASGQPTPGVDCGPEGDESCCLSSIVQGGTYYRSNNPSFPAQISDFRLDRFEVTVGRYRAFVDGYPSNRPLPGVGAHANLPESGWQAEWDSSLPVDRDALVVSLKCDPTFQTWTDTPGVNEAKPINCISWYEAFAFCAWDGGRLVTEAEWNYAAAGGDEQRLYPWGDAAASQAHASYDCTGDGSTSASCAATDLLRVGSRSSQGDGRWGQADLAGNIDEFLLDRFVTSYPMPCDDCANLTIGAGRVLRGGSFSDELAIIDTVYRTGNLPLSRNVNVGVRCARPL